MWVADQDLCTPEFVIDALKSRLEHPILGYTSASAKVYQAIIDWQARHHYHITQAHIVFTHNVANGFYMAVQAFTRPGDAVLVQTPVYPPFLQAPIVHQRRLVSVPLVLSHSPQPRYHIDFAEFEQTIVQQNVKLFLFCHPQNPSGRVWLKDELERIAAICLRHKVLVVSDEIHSDLLYPGHTHIPMASLSPAIAANTVTLNSPGKTFNLGGLHIGYALLANPQHKTAYLQVAQGNAINNLNVFAYVALQAAYSVQGFTWKQQRLSEFANNINQVIAFFAEHFPTVNVMRPEASFLIWLDFNALFSEQSALKNWLVQHAKLGLNDGQTFGHESGQGFMRLNIAVSFAVLQDALQRLQQAKAFLPQS
jgi:cystathionine beta-lyase